MNLSEFGVICVVGCQVDAVYPDPTLQVIKNVASSRLNVHDWGYMSQTQEEVTTKATSRLPHVKDIMTILPKLDVM